MGNDLHFEPPFFAQTAAAAGSVTVLRQNEADGFHMDVSAAVGMMSRNGEGLETTRAAFAFIVISVRINAKAVERLGQI